MTAVSWGTYFFVYLFFMLGINAATALVGIQSERYGNTNDAGPRCSFRWNSLAPLLHHS